MGRNIYNWNKIRDAVNRRFNDGRPFTMNEIVEKYHMTKSTLSYRIKEDMKKGLIWKLDYHTPPNHEVPNNVVAKNINDIEIIQRAIEKAWDMIRYVKDGKEFDNLSSGIVKLLQCKKELEEGKSETNLDTVQLPDNVKSILNN